VKNWFQSEVSKRGFKARFQSEFSKFAFRWVNVYRRYASVPVFRPAMKIPSTQDGTHPANRVSTLKYDLLRKFIATVGLLNNLNPVDPWLEKRLVSWNLNVCVCER
jgi:hypothetical protein